jgi:hypothetical protein
VEPTPLQALVARLDLCPSLSALAVRLQQPERVARAEHSPSLSALVVPLVMAAHPVRVALLLSLPGVLAT